jgi:hypothetical protein
MFSNFIDENIKFDYRSVIFILLVAMHWIMFSGTMLVILMTNDLSILVLANLFLYLVLVMNIIFGDCPMTLIEEQYLGASMIDAIGHFVPFNYNTSSRGNYTLQWIFMTIMVSTSKIILLLMKYCFQEFLTI